MKRNQINRRTPATVIFATSLALGLLGIVMIGIVPVLGFFHRLYILICLFTAFCAALFLPGQSASVRRITRPLRWITLVCTLLVLLSFVGVELLILSHESGDEHPQGEVLIVLGAGLNGEEPSLSLRARLDRAQEFLEQHPDTIAVLSGGQGPDEAIPEAVAMQRYLLARGVDADRLLIEQQSHSTWQNLLYSRQLLVQELGQSPEQVVILSNGFHLFRAEFLAERLGFAADTVAAPLPEGVSFLISHLREYFAVVKSFFIDRVEGRVQSQLLITS